MNKEKNKNIDSLSNKIEINKCVLCHDAPCGKLYKNVNPERIIRALKLNNEKGARSLIKNKKSCLKKNINCKAKCPLNVNIDGILTNILNNIDKIDNYNDVDISSEMCGVKLENPFLLSSSIVGSRYEMCKRAFKQSGYQDAVI